jgi:SAM-dependent methyltransferase
LGDNARPMLAMNPPPSPPSAPHTPAVDLADAPAWLAFCQQLESAWRGEQALSLVLSKPRSAQDDLARVKLRRVQLKSGVHVQLVYSHATRDITRNLPLEPALLEVQALLQGRLMQAHAHELHPSGGASKGLTLLISRKGKVTLTGALRPSAAAAQAAPHAHVPEPSEGLVVREPMHAAPQGPAHNRDKRRLLDPKAPFLQALGVMDAQGRLIPAMARKWKQINKFVEIYRHAHERAGLPLQPGSALDVVDFGCGKGYLTFALHAWAQAQGLQARVTGVELRPDLVAFTEAAARACEADGLRFVQGDVRSVAPPRVDVMVALHACDVATDHAIHAGIRAQARVILCSPCCHKEIRPQLLSPHPLRPVLQHGIHQGQQAEMLTDSLRALWLEAQGFDAQVFEFISLEHTQKNKMILGVRRQESATAAARREAQALEQIQSLKAFYGVRSHTLEHLLGKGSGV